MQSLTELERNVRVFFSEKTLLKKEKLHQSAAHFYLVIVISSLSL